MMKILVLSDSHGAVAPMVRAIRQVQPDEVIHLGDCVPDALALGQRFPALPLHIVVGNNDQNASAPDRLLLTVGGVAVLAVHGHQYGVYNGPLRLSLAARELGVDVALYGHTHQAACTRTDSGLWLLNPGACGAIYPTCGVLEIANGGVTCYNAKVDPAPAGQE